MRSHSYRIITRRAPDGSIVKTVTRLHPVWRGIGRAICVWVAVTWPLTLGVHHDGTISPLGWIAFACWIPVVVAAAWLLRRRTPTNRRNR